MNDAEPSKQTKPTARKPDRLRITIQRTERLRGLSFEERRDYLAGWFRDLQARLEGLDLKVRAKSLSPLGQSIEADLPAAALIELEVALRDELARVELVETRDARQRPRNR